MYGPRNSIAHYRQAHRAVDTDDPHRIIALLLAGAIERTRLAEACLQRGDVPGKINAIHSALDIIEGLRLSLDHEAGGEVAAGLESIYEYSSFRLIEANAENDVARLREVAGLLGEIGSAWAAIAGQAGTLPAPGVADA